jgi:hypothetical protein
VLQTSFIYFFYFLTVKYRLHIPCGNNVSYVGLKIKKRKICQTDLKNIEKKQKLLIYLIDSQQFFSSLSLIFSFDPYLNRRVMNAYGELIELRIFFFFVYLCAFYSRSILLHAASAHH